MVPYLWKHNHSLHHRIHTPTPASTVFIDPLDATLQGGLPIIVATAVVRPHWLTFCVYTGVRIAENVCNHSGLDERFVDVVTLRVLPGRARMKHHDHHHQFSNYGPSAKNFGEMFWVWDWMHGTLAGSRKEAYPVGRDD